MAITIADGFQYLGKKSLDSRTSYATLALMKAVSDSNINEGCLAYCEETDKYYKFLSSNTVDTDTGKWREYSSGGGNYTAGDGINIEDDEISTDNMQSGDIADVTYPLPSPGPGVTSLGGLTDVSISDPQENETLLYNPTTQKWENGEGGKTYTAGDGISIDSNDEISTDSMQSGDMDEVVDTLPGIASRYHKYSTTEQIVGEWIDGSKIYEKTLSTGTLSNATNSFDVSALHIGNLLDVRGFLTRSTGEQLLIPTVYILKSDLTQDVEIGWISLENNTLKIFNGLATLSNITSSYITLRYTKS